MSYEYGIHQFTRRRISPERLDEPEIGGDSDPSNQPCCRCPCRFQTIGSSMKNGESETPILSYLPTMYQTLEPFADKLLFLAAFAHPLSVPLARDVGNFTLHVARGKESIHQQTQEAGASVLRPIGVLPKTSNRVTSLVPAAWDSRPKKCMTPGNDQCTIHSPQMTFFFSSCS